MQEKAADRQADIDALRAKRAFEQNERIFRAKEKADAEKRAKQAQDLDYARKKQFLEKEIMMANQAKTEREAFLKVIEAQRAAEEQDRRLEAEKNAVMGKHATTIR